MNTVKHITNTMDQAIINIQDDIDAFINIIKENHLKHMEAIMYKNQLKELKIQLLKGLTDE